MAAPSGMTPSGNLEDTCAGRYQYICLRRCRRRTHPASPGMTPGGTSAHIHENGGRGRCGASGGAGEVSARASSSSGWALRANSASFSRMRSSAGRRGSGAIGSPTSDPLTKATSCAMVWACSSSGVRGARRAGRGRPLRRTWRLRGMGNILSCGCIRTGQNRPGDGSDSPSRKGPARRAPWHLAKILGRLRSEVLPPAAPMTGFRTGCRICLSPARGRKRAVAGVCRLPFFPSLRLKAQASSRNLVHWTKFNPARSHLAFHEPTQGLNLSRRARVRCSRSCLICHPSAPASRIQARPHETLKAEYGGGRLASDKLSFIRRYPRSLRPCRWGGAGIQFLSMDTCLRRCRRTTHPASPDLIRGLWRLGSGPRLILSCVTPDRASGLGVSLPQRMDAQMADAIGHDARRRVRRYLRRQVSISAPWTPAFAGVCGISRSAHPRAGGEQ